MNVPLRRFTHSSSIAAILLAAVAVTVTGCSMDPSQSGPSASPALSGITHGGPNPVVGAVVTLYATQTNGYGGAGKVLATTVTASDGSFSFTPSSYTCPGGQQAYITSAAGNTGANIINPNSLLMAAIGPCSSLNGNTYIWIDELSTVAAAYALGNFMSISGTGSAAVVNVSAPANNNAATGSCTGTGTAMTCVAAGLPHAFLNAANLVNSIGTSSAIPTGQAYSTPPSNPTTSGTAVALQNVAPQQLINTLGNIVQACVNSTGGIAGGASACGTLFTNTTPSTTYTASPVTPTNTLQAMVNLAKFPFTGTSNLYNIAQSSGYYQPTLTAAPPDFSVAILYRSYSSANNQIGSVYYTTTDINDNVYATALTATSTGSATGTQPLVAHSLASNGVSNWAAPAQISSSSTILCTQYGGTAATSAPCEAATDTAGHLWVALGANGVSAGGVYQVNTASAAVTPFTTAVNGLTYYPLAIAVDRNNDVFYSGTLQSSSGDNLFELPSGSASTTVPTAVSTGGATFVGGHTSDSIVFDTAGNIFAPLATGGNVGFNYIANTGTLSAEAFGTTANQCNCLGSAQGIDSWPTGGMVDANGNYWMTGQNGVYEIAAGATNAQNVTGGGSTGVNSFALGNSNTVLRISSMDGAGTIFVPDVSTAATKTNPSPPPAANTPALRIYYTGMAAQAAITGCNTAGSTTSTTCVTANSGAPNNQMFYQSINPAIDATGSLWISSEGNDAIIQVIGLAAPTWPQASYLHPGVMPQ